MEKRKWHPSVTLERVIGVVRNSSISLDDPGICVLCGADAESVMGGNNEFKDYCGQCYAEALCQPYDLNPMLIHAMMDEG